MTVPIVPGTKTKTERKRLVKEADLSKRKLGWRSLKVPLEANVMKGDWERERERESEEERG